MVGPLGTLPGVTLGSVSGSIFWRPFHGTPGQNSESKRNTCTWFSYLRDTKETYNRHVSQVKLFLLCSFSAHEFKCLSWRYNKAVFGRQHKLKADKLRTWALLTWWPVDIGPIGHFVTAAFALSPAVWRHQRAGRRVWAGYQAVGAVRFIQLSGLSRRAQVGT